MRIFLCFILIVSKSIYCSAINDSVAIQKKVATHPKATLKINPTCLIDFNNNSLYLSSDIWLHKNVVVEVGSGWFFGSALNYKGENLNGYRGRLGIKYLFVNTTRALPFFGLEAKYNYIKSLNFETFCRYGCQYTEVLTLDKVKNTAGLAIKPGCQFLFGKKKNFSFDVYIGFGFKYSHFASNVPEDAEEIRGRHEIFFIDRTKGGHYLFDMLTGVNLGYCFW